MLLLGEVGGCFVGEFSGVGDEAEVVEFVVDGGFEFLPAACRWSARLVVIGSCMFSFWVFLSP
ncbi:hypothetical protein CIP103987_01125 [Corynebacterium diphtheriae]|nr:hypothetical protein CIP103987_01125 [Corynebacterium diphtheriae]CAB0552068.1 hypothetical protein CIP107526_01121 [Corynebacterium diphtheriae]